MKIRHLGLIAYAALALVAANGARGSDWPMAGQNAQRTGRNPDTQPLNTRGIWCRFLEEQICTYVQPVAVNGLVYVGTMSGRMHALDLGTGEPRWVFDAGSPIGNAPAVADGLLVTATYHGRIIALKADTGVRVWEFDAVPDGKAFSPLASGFWGAPVVADGAVYLASRNGFLYALNLADGKPRWKHDLGTEVLFSAAYGDGAVFTAGLDCRAYAVEAATGKRRWTSEPLPGAGKWYCGYWYYWPVVVGERVFFRAAGTWAGVNQMAKEREPPFGKDPNVKPFEWQALGERLRTLWQGKQIDAAGLNREVIKAIPEAQNVFGFATRTGQPEPAVPILYSCGVMGNAFPPAADAAGRLYAQTAVLSEILDAPGVVYIPQALTFRYDPATGEGGFLNGYFRNNHDETTALSLGSNIIYRTHQGWGIQAADVGQDRQVMAVREMPFPVNEGTIKQRFSNYKNGPGRSAVVVVDGHLLYIEHSNVICCGE